MRHTHRWETATELFMDNDWILSNVKVTNKKDGTYLMAAYTDYLLSKFWFPCIFLNNSMFTFVRIKCHRN